MTQIIKIIQNDEAPFNITWVLNNICTNKCSYCPSDLHSGKNHHYDWENAKRFIEILFKKFKNIHCSIAGGEPSVSPFLKDLVKMFYENGGTVGLTSNAAKSADFWLEISPYLNYACFSWHAEFPDGKFKDKVLSASKNTLVTVRVMMHPLFWKESLAVYNEFFNLDRIECEAVRVLNWTHDVNGIHSKYTIEQEEWFIQNQEKGVHSRGNKHYKDNYYSNIKQVKFQSDFYFDDGSIVSTGAPVAFINSGLTNFNGYKCLIGQKEIFIDWRGYIRPGNCDVGGWFGNINYPEAINWPTTPFTCTKTICHCASDVLVDKWKE